MRNTSLALTDDDKTTLRTAAYGAVTLLSAADAAGSPHKLAAAGFLALNSAIGPIGHVLAEKSKVRHLNGRSVAEIADQVLPALTASTVLLAKQDRARADDFRDIVAVAVDAALQARTGELSPTLARMTDKISEALAAASPLENDRPDLQKAVEAFVGAGFAGLQMRVNDEHGEWVGTAGVRKLGETGAPPADGRFWAGSVAKTFTATLVLQLVADGKTGLDAPVADHLPGLGLDPRITVRMLLQHTSGLFNYTGEYFPDGTIVPGIPATGKEWVEARLRSYRPQELVELALAQPARFEPGADWSYSNTNYTLATLLIEQAGGGSFADQMDQRILRPLGLRDTVLAGDVTDLPEPHAHGYYRYQDGAEWKVTDVSRQNLSMLLGAGGAISTTRDLHTFFAALNGGKLLPAPLLAEMRTPGGPIGYGLGLFVQELGPGNTVYHHNGGATGGYGALMYSSPDGRKTLTAGLTMGDAPVDPAEVFPQALDALVREVFRG